MIADLGTHQGVSITDVDQSSVWINGYEWMRQEQSRFPIKSITELKLSDDELKEANKEFPLPQAFFTDVPTRIVPAEVSKRHQFSRYLIDPNKHAFREMVRIIAFVYKFITACRSSINKKKSSHFSSSTIPRIYFLIPLFISKSE